MAKTALMEPTGRPEGRYLIALECKENGTLEATYSDGSTSTVAGDIIFAVPSTATRTGR